MKKIAIQGHLTRGKDVIKILESLGGINKLGLEGFKPAGFYYIEDNNYINCKSYYHIMNKYTGYTLEQYEQKFNMEKRNIQIDLTTAKEWYKQGGDLRKVALQAFSEKELKTLPTSWKEYCEINPYLTKDKEFFLAPDGTITNIPHQYYQRVDFALAMSSKKRAEQFVVLSKLLQIRDYYNQGCKLDWINDTEDKYVIKTNKNELCRCTSWFSNYIFAFKTRELRDEFF